MYYIMSFFTLKYFIDPYGKLLLDICADMLSLFQGYLVLVIKLEIRPLTMRYTYNFI